MRRMNSSVHACWLLYYQTISSPWTAAGVFLHSYHVPCSMAERAKPSQFQRCCSPWCTRLCKSLGGFPCMISCCEEPSAPLIHALMLQNGLLPSPACKLHAEQRLYQPISLKFKTPLHMNGKIGACMEFPWWYYLGDQVMNQSLIAAEDTQTQIL